MTRYAALFVLAVLGGCGKRHSLYGVRSEDGGCIGACIEILQDKPDAHPDTVGTARFPTQQDRWPMTVRRTGAKERYELRREDKVVGTLEWDGGNWMTIIFTVDTPYKPFTGSGFRKGERVRVRDDKPGVFY